MSDMTQMVFDKIERLKEAYGISDNEIAQGIGLSKSSYSRIRNGKTNFTLETLSSIASFFNLPPYYLLLSTERYEKHSFAEQLSTCLQSLDWSYEKLSEETGISIFRFMDFDQGANPSEDELQRIEHALQTNFPQILLDPREYAIQLLLEELGLEERQVKNILKYIGEHKATKELF